VLVGFEAMKSVEAVVVIHSKRIAGLLGHGPTGPADDEVDISAEDEHHMGQDAEVDMLVGDGHCMTRDAVAANNEGCWEGGCTLP